MSRFAFRAAAVSLVVVFADTASALPTGKSELAPVTKPPPGPPTFQEPQWPVRFDLHVAEPSTNVFAVGTAGPITVDVTFNSEPITVTLRRPDGSLVVQRATQSPLSFKAMATDADVKTGPLWSVTVRTTRDPVVLAPGTTSTSTQGAKPILNGTVSVAHPAGNATLVAQAIAKAYATPPPPAVPAKPVALATPDVVALKNAELDKQRATKRLAALDQIKSRLPADVTLRATKTFGAPTTPQPTTSSTSAAAVGVAGSNTPATVAADPAIASLSVAEGEPGDPVLVTGTAFSGTQGEVHFIVANGRDLAAPITAWNDTQILAAVPTIAGVPSYAGYVYVQRGAQKSKLVPFRFKPTLAFKTLAMTSDRKFAQAPDSIFPNDGVHYWFGFIFGGKNDDQFFLQTKLKNDWVVDSAYVVVKTTNSYGTTVGTGDAYITDLRAGTDSPYVKVHWWANPGSGISYQPFVIVKGPKDTLEQ